MTRILVTGGAGFIGSHLVDALIARGHVVRALDSLVPQVHGQNAQCPSWLPNDVEQLMPPIHFLWKHDIVKVDSLIDILD